MHRIAIIMSIIGGLASMVSYADQLPPLGQRVYLLDQKARSQPVQIKPIQNKDDESGQVRMKDPLPLGAHAIIGQSGAIPQAKAPTRISRMVFDRNTVQGRYLVPRVSFDRPILEVGRREEPIKVDYRKKIHESERELREFDW
jgi:hypothetical protein